MTMADDEMEVLRLTGVTGRLEDIESIYSHGSHFEVPAMNL